MTGARISDSAMYGHLWGTPAVRAVFEERGRLQGWLEVLAALARAQAAEAYPHLARALELKPELRGRMQK